jgi:hypothetical protein
VIVEYVLGVEPMKELPVEVRRCRDLVLAQPEQHHRPSEPGAVGTLRVGTPFVCRHTFLQFGGYGAHIRATQLPPPDEGTMSCSSVHQKSICLESQVTRARNSSSIAAGSSGTSFHTVFSCGDQKARSSYETGDEKGADAH